MSTEKRLVRKHAIRFGGDVALWNGDFSCFVEAAGANEPPSLRRDDGRPLLGFERSVLCFVPVEWSLFSRKRGQPVKYGVPVRLVCPATQMMATVLKTDGGNGRFGFRVVMRPFEVAPVTGSTFRVLSKFKARRSDIDLVYEQDNVAIMVENTELSLSVVEEAKTLHLVASVDPAAWSIRLYDGGYAFQHQGEAHTGRMVAFQHRGDQTLLTCGAVRKCEASSHPQQRRHRQAMWQTALEEEGDDAVVIAMPAPSALPALTSPTVAPLHPHSPANAAPTSPSHRQHTEEASPLDTTTGSSAGENVFAVARGGGQVRFVHTFDNDAVGATHDDEGNDVATAPRAIYLWIVEGVDPSVGGPIRVGEHYRLRHCVSGRYLCVKQLAIAKYAVFAVEATSLQTPSVVATNGDGDTFFTESTLFAIDASTEHATGHIFFHQSHVRFRHVATGVWLTTDYLSAGTVSSGGGSSSSPQSDDCSSWGAPGLSLLASPRPSMKDRITVCGVPPRVEAHLSFLLLHVRILEQYVDKMHGFQGNPLTADRLLGEPHVVCAIEGALESLSALQRFCTGEENQLPLADLLYNRGDDNSNNNNNAVSSFAVSPAATAAGGMTNAADLLASRSALSGAGVADGSPLMTATPTEQIGSARSFRLTQDLMNSTTTDRSNSDNNHAGSPTTSGREPQSDGGGGFSSSSTAAAATKATAAATAARHHVFPNRRRQLMMVDAGLHNLVVRVICAPFRGTNSSAELPMAGGVIPIAAIHDRKYRLIRSVLRECLALLRQLLLHSPSNCSEMMKLVDLCLYLERFHLNAVEIALLPLLHSNTALTDGEATKATETIADLNRRTPRASYLSALALLCRSEEIDTSSGVGHPRSAVQRHIMKHALPRDIGLSVDEGRLVVVWTMSVERREGEAAGYQQQSIRGGSTLTASRLGSGRDGEEDADQFMMATSTLEFEAFLAHGEANRIQYFAAYCRLLLALSETNDEECFRQVQELLPRAQIMLALHSSPKRGRDENTADTIKALFTRLAVSLYLRNDVTVSDAPRTLFVCVSRAGAAAAAVRAAGGAASPTSSSLAGAALTSPLSSSVNSETGERGLPGTGCDNEHDSDSEGDDENALVPEVLARRMEAQESALGGAGSDRARSGPRPDRFDSGTVGGGSCEWRRSHSRGPAAVDSGFLRQMKSVALDAIRETNGVLVADLRGRNELLLACVDMWHLLVKSQVCDRSELQEVLLALCHLLDGRSDVASLIPAGSLGSPSWDRFQLTEDTLLISKCKVGVCKLLETFLDLTLRDAVNSVVSHLSSADLPATPEAASAVTNAATRVVDDALAAIAVDNLMLILVDLIQYRYPELVGASAHLIAKLRTMGQQLSTGVNALRVVRDEDAGMYRAVASLVARLLVQHDLLVQVGRVLASASASTATTGGATPGGGGVLSSANPSTAAAAYARLERNTSFSAPTVGPNRRGLSANDLTSTLLTSNARNVIKDTLLAMTALLLTGAVGGGGSSAGVGIAKGADVNSGGGGPGQNANKPQQLAQFATAVSNHSLAMANRSLGWISPAQQQQQQQQHHADASGTTLQVFSLRSPLSFSAAPTEWTNPMSGRTPPSSPSPQQQQQQQRSSPRLLQMTVTPAMTEYLDLLRYWGVASLVIDVLPCPATSNVALFAACCDFLTAFCSVADNIEEVASQWPVIMEGLAHGGELRRAALALVVRLWSLPCASRVARVNLRDIRLLVAIFVDDENADAIKALVSLLSAGVPLPQHQRDVAFCLSSAGIFKTSWWRAYPQTTVVLIAHLLVLCGSDNLSVAVTVRKVLPLSTVLRLLQGSNANELEWKTILVRFLTRFYFQLEDAGSSASATFARRAELHADETWWRIVRDDFLVRFESLASMRRPLKPEAREFTFEAVLCLGVYFPHCFAGASREWFAKMDWLVKDLRALTLVTASVLQSYVSDRLDNPLTTAAERQAMVTLARALCDALAPIRDTGLTRLKELVVATTTEHRAPPTVRISNSPDAASSARSPVVSSAPLTAPPAAATAVVPSAGPTASFAANALVGKVVSVQSSLLVLVKEQVAAAWKANDRITHVVQAIPLPMQLNPMASTDRSVKVLRRLLGGCVRQEFDSATTQTILATVDAMIRTSPPHRFVAVQRFIDALGALHVATTLLDAADPDIVEKSLSLGIALLDCPAGNTVVQNSFLQYVSTTDEKLFLVCRRFVDRSILELRFAQRVSFARGTSSDWGLERRGNSFPSMQRLFRFLQLLCEGHHFGLQNYLREQGDNLRSVNVLRLALVFLGALLHPDLRLVDSQHAALLLQMFNFLTECCQGPCPANQAVLVASDLPRLADQVLRDPRATAALKVAVVTCLLSVVEGCRDPHVAELLLMKGQLSIRTLDVLFLGASAAATRAATSASTNADNDDSSEDLAFGVGIFLRVLADLLVGLPLFHDVVQLLRQRPDIGKRTGRIQILRRGELELVYFRVPLSSTHIQPDMRSKLLWEADRSSQSSKHVSFFELCDELILELDLVCAFECALRTRTDEWLGVEWSARIAPYVTPSTKAWMRKSVIVAACANMALLLGSDPDAAVFHLFALAQLVISVLIFFLDWCIGANVAVHRHKKVLTAARNARLADFQDAPPIVVTALQQLALKLNRQESIGSLVMLLAAIGSVVFTPFFLVVHLFWVLSLSSSLSNVVRAVTQNKKSVGQTMILGLLFCYTFAIIGYTLFPDDFGGDSVVAAPQQTRTQPERRGGSAATAAGVSSALPTWEAGQARDEQQQLKRPQQQQQANCESLLQCFVFIVVSGLRQGGGVGDLMREKEWGTEHFVTRRMFDFLFFGIVVVVILNLLFGIIIDTFGSLRDARQRKEEDMRLKCFICGIDSHVFDRLGDGFRAHIKLEHSMWQYLHFIHYLRLKDKNEYTGQESYVARLLFEKDFSFFPTGRCLSLDDRLQAYNRDEGGGTSSVENDGSPAGVEPSAAYFTKAARGVTTTAATRTSWAAPSRGHGTDTRPHGNFSIPQVVVTDSSFASSSFSGPLDNLRPEGNDVGSGFRSEMDELRMAIRRIAHKMNEPPSPHGAASGGGAGGGRGQSRHPVSGSNNAVSNMSFAGGNMSLCSTHGMGGPQRSAFSYDGASQQAPGGSHSVECQTDFPDTSFDMLLQRNNAVATCESLELENRRLKNEVRVQADEIWRLQQMTQSTASIHNAVSGLQREALVLRRQLDTTASERDALLRRTVFLQGESDRLSADNARLAAAQQLQQVWARVAMQDPFPMHDRPVLRETRNAFDFSKTMQSSPTDSALRGHDNDVDNNAANLAAGGNEVPLPTAGELSPSRTDWFRPLDLSGPTSGGRERQGDECQL